MVIHQPALILIAGIASVLILASLVALGLKIKIAKGLPHEVIDNLNARIHSWWTIAAALGMALWAGHGGLTVLFAFASFAALREFTGVTRVAAAQPVVMLGFLIALPVQYLAIAVGSYEIYSIFIPFAAFLALPLVAAVKRDGVSEAPRLPVVQWGLVLCVYCISFVPALLTLHVPGYEGRNAYLPLFLLLVVQGSDIFQYVWGKLAGRRKLVPALSPNKTAEGTIGGVLSATALGAALSPLTPFTVTESALVSLAMTVLGVLGGLLMSGVKRHRGLKDWGTLIKGHGGMLDRLDSVCLSAPVFFYIVRVGWAA